ncbi:hypothetical protein [Nocardia blacklockiae]|uniref:hypothetical protein n=1 Tax=Nocardia blacklockiae TaxID=480036 RepID=UPI00189615A2|nr:hypothetical protein [Nocardia blacklockiae]MBF6171084.1 hypothetical protein [Nocardia blacklockiae]
MTTGRAFGIVREDISRTLTSTHVRQLGELAAARRLELFDEVLVAANSARFGQLLATFPDGGIETLLIPSLLHLSDGWVDVTRRQADIWTLDPLKRWPRVRVPMTRTIAG